jgi:hypothetical protein
VDHRSIGGSRGTKEIIDHSASTQATTPIYAQSAGRRFAAIYLLHDSRGKHRASSRAGGRRARIPSAASSLLHQRSPQTLKNIVPPSSEAVIRGTSSRSQALALLLRPQSHSSHRISIRRYSSQQGSCWENSQMGVRAWSSRYRVPTPLGDKNSSTGQLHIRVD